MCLTLQSTLHSCISSKLAVDLISSFVTLKDWIVSWRPFCNYKKKGIIFSSSKQRQKKTNIYLPLYLWWECAPYTEQMIQQEAVREDSFIMNMALDYKHIEVLLKQQKIGHIKFLLFSYIIFKLMFTWTERGV